MLDQREKDIVLNLIIRLCKEDTNYINSKFSENKIYIDGCIKYLDDKEKLVIEKWMSENDIKNFEEKN